MAAVEVTKYLIPAWRNPIKSLNFQPVSKNETPEQYECQEIAQLWRIYHT